MERPPLHGGDLEAARARRAESPGGFLDFSANINPLGPPPRTVAAAQEALPGIAHSPEPFARRLRAALAGRHRVQEPMVLVGNGAAKAAAEAAVP